MQDKCSQNYTLSPHAMFFKVTVNMIITVIQIKGIQWPMTQTFVPYGRCKPMMPFHAAFHKHCTEPWCTFKQGLFVEFVEESLKLFLQPLPSWIMCLRDDSLDVLWELLVFRRSFYTAECLEHCGYSIVILHHEVAHSDSEALLMGRSQLLVLCTGFIRAPPLLHQSLWSWWLGKCSHIELLPWPGKSLRFF